MHRLLYLALLLLLCIVVTTSSGAKSSSSPTTNTTMIKDTDKIETIPDSDLVCVTYKHGKAVVELCELEMEAFIIEEDRRVTKTHLYLTNVGTVGVCNISFWLDGMFTEDLLDYWPEWVYIRDNEAYLAPDEGMDLGGNVYMDSGWPDYYIAEGFHECEAPDAVPPGFKPCHTFKSNHDQVILKWCVDKSLKSWTENDGTTTLSVKGKVYNNGTLPVCNLTFSLDRIEEATALSPDWFPIMTPDNSPAPLREGDEVVVSASMPAAGGRPELRLESFEACPDDYMMEGGGQGEAAVVAKGDDEDETDKRWWTGLRPTA